MVSYRGKDGKQSYHQTDEVSDAIQFVEHLRNDESVDQARIFKLEELSFEFRPYYRVELATTLPPPPANDAPAESAWMAAHEEAVDDADPLAAAWTATERPEPEVHEEAPVGAGMGRKGLFGR